jgi:hypothetical protein
MGEYQIVKNRKIKCIFVYKNLSERYSVFSIFISIIMKKVASNLTKFSKTALPKQEMKKIRGGVENVTACPPILTCN